jgi:hypothetical protein
MGLFDGYFDPGTYSGNSGGLIDRLLAQLGPQAQYQPSAGLPPQSDPNAATPIGVGNYQMPRMGSADQYQPQQAMMPPNAQPTQGQLPAQTPQEQAAGLLPAPMRGAPTPSPGQLPPQLQPPGSGFGDHLIAGAQNFAHGGGLISALVNGVTGLATGQRTDPQGMQAATLRSEYEALIASGVPEAKARLAVINPEFGKTIVGEAFGKDKFSVVKTGQNGLGQETYRVFNPATGQFQDMPKSDNGPDESGLGNTNLTGKEYLATVPAAQRGTVQGVAEGTVPFPGAFALTKPYWQGIVQAVKQYDPSFDATAWGGRVAGVKDFSSGKSSEMVRSANQTLHHVGKLLTSMDALNNGNYPPLNRIENTASEAMGSGAQGAFRTNAHAVATELSKVFKGSNLSDAEVHAWEENLHENMSPEQQRAQIAKVRDLLQGSLDALEEKRQNSMGPMAAEKAGPLIKDEGQKVLQHIDDWLGKGNKNAAPGGATRTGVKWSVE